MTIEQTRMQREHVWREILQYRSADIGSTSIIRIFLRSPRRWFWSYRSWAVCNQVFTENRTQNTKPMIISHGLAIASKILLRGRLHRA